MYRAILCLFLMLYATECLSFVTLSQASDYSMQHPEFPEPDNDIIDNPSFTHFYQSQRPSMAKQLGLWLGIVKSDWNPYAFYRLLTTTAEHYKPLIGYYAATVTATQGTQCIVISDLNGNFHSLVRILQELHTRKVIDNNFKLIHPHLYFIINGNGIGPSAYALQTLELLLRLLQANPTTCIYTTGYYEEKKRWAEGPFRQALDAVFTPRKQALPLLENLFNALFAATYISTPDSETSLRISYLGNENRQLKGDVCSRKVPVQTITPCLLTQKEQSQEPVSVLVTAPKSSDLTQDIPVLNFKQDKNRAHWSFTSSASMQYRMKYRYFYDAFAVITIGKTINSSTITLYNRDVRENKHFNYTAARNVYTGKKVAANSQSSDPLDYLAYGRNQ